MLARLKLGQKIAFSFVLAALLAAASAAVAWRSSSTVAAQLLDISDAKVPSLDALKGIDEAQTAVWGSTVGLLSRHFASHEFRPILFKNAEDAFKRMDESWARYDALPHGAEALRRWKALAAPWAEWRRQSEASIAFIRDWERLRQQGVSVDDPRIQEIIKRAGDNVIATQRLYDTTAGHLRELVEQTRKDVQAREEEALAASSLQNTLLLAGLVVSGALLALLGTYLARTIRTVIGDLNREAKKLADAAAEGALEVRGDPASVNFEFRGVVEGMNAAMDAFQKPIDVTVDYVTRISKGDLPPAITETYEGDFDKIKLALNGCIGALSGLIEEMNRMSAAHDAGDIDATVDARRFHGAYATMATGINTMVAGHIAVKKKAMACVAEFGKGNFDAALEKFPGKKAFINETVEKMRGNVKGFIAEMTRMSAEHDKGDIDVVIPADRFEGDFRRMAEGVNGMVGGHIAVKKKAMACIAEFGRGNFEAPLERFPGKKAFINETIEKVRGNLKALIADANALSAAAVEGKLSTRADATKHEGDFRRIVEGVNGTLDAVMRPIEEAASVLEKLAARDLTARVKGSYQGDHARIKEALNATAEALHEALAQVAQAVTQVSAAAGQIASSSQAVADGASEQASSLEETSSSLESMASMTKQASDNAQQANGLAQTAKGAAAEGGAAMEQMTGAMGKIKASAEGTSQIIKDINEIAFQTNLLALNAAVEAARAGEAGRGFAVVAEEVRSLAMRSKEAAQKTEELIRQSVKEAGEGEVTARHVSEKLGEIATSISKVSEIVAEIAASAKEQSAGIDQVNKAVGQMDKVTQQNAANSEESSSAAAELSGQSEELAAMIGTFQLERAGATVRPVAPQARKAAPTAKPARAASRARQGSGIAVRPEDVIPMEGDPAFKEF